MSAVTSAIRHPRDLFPPQMFGVHIIDDATAQDAHNGDDDMLRRLHPQESVLVAGAIDKRRRQFAAGRHCAHRALAALHADSDRVLHDAHGAPTWPDGMVGSISHTEGLAIGVVARRAQVVAVGVDVESRREAFPLSVLPQICLESEHERLQTLPDVERMLYAAAYFSIKEAVYKCVYAVSGERFGFHDACVEFDLRCGVFVARLSRPLLNGVREIDGRIGCNDDFVFSGAWRLCEAATAFERTAATARMSALSVEPFSAAMPFVNIVPT